ncbi:transmembrane protein, putative [Medicago truncatula]|uniref:Transmembrane protein, putative n=1 Tax=Medicago truncatula TaxID=3880 RepID=G7ITD7_MEDTR|nr:transmembrane protein, putative [Medicago truncatula]
MLSNSKHKLNYVFSQTSLHFLHCYFHNVEIENFSSSSLLCFTPPYLFVTFNAIIISIVASSRFHQSHT